MNFLLIWHFYSEKSHPPEQRQRLFEDIEVKLQQQPGDESSALVGHKTNEAKTVTGVPSLEYEQMRRRVRSNTQELWNYVNNEITKVWQGIKKVAPDMGPKLDEVMSMVTEHKRALMNDIDTMQTIDGYEQWRHNEAEALSGLVQRRLNYLQNPEDCSTARKLVCRLNKVCVLNHTKKSNLI